MTPTERQRALVDAAYHGYFFREPNLAVEQLGAILAYRDAREEQELDRAAGFPILAYSSPREKEEAPA